MAGLRVVPVMGALFQSRGWLPIVEAPGYFRHPTSILAMRLLKNGKAAGCDNIHVLPEAIKVGGDMSKEVLLDLRNRIWSEEKVPEE